MGLLKFTKQLFCNHNFIFVRNVYGDEISLLGGNRSIWSCSECMKVEYRRTLWSYPPQKTATPSSRGNNVSQDAADELPEPFALYTQRQMQAQSGEDTKPKTESRPTHGQSLDRWTPTSDTAPTRPADRDSWCGSSSSDSSSSSSSSSSDSSSSSCD